MIFNSKPSKIADNISKSEREALQTLINHTDIVIKLADKGKATVILNIDDYKKECYLQLNDSKLYRKLQKDTAHHIEERIKCRLKDMMIDDEIDEEIYKYLLLRRSRPARFYILPKIHKNNNNPPGRPSVSATSHPTEHISQFVDTHLNPLVPKLPPYIEDTTHFLRKLDDLKELPPGSLLVTLDVSSLYTNIPHEERIKACRKALNSSGHLSRFCLKTESICDLMRMILTMNNFEFDNNHFIQLHRTAMGTRFAPAYTNLFMGDLEEKHPAQFPLKPYLWLRYIDDIFIVWTHGEDKLEDFINHINSLHNTIKFTHEFSKSHISFLDVTVSLDNNNMISKVLFVKSTHTHQYLLHTSCHPSHIKKSIPFSLALHIHRICSTTEKFKQRTNKLLEFLCKRGHRRPYV